MGVPGGTVPGGLILGYAAGLAATRGPHPPWPPRRLVRPMLGLVGFVGFVAGVAGLSADRHLGLFDAFPAGAPAWHRWAFVVACAHWAAYVAAVVGSVGVCVWVGRSRGRTVDAPAVAV